MNRIATALALLVVSAPALAHRHTPREEPAKPTRPADAAERERRLKQIDARYVASIKPIFESKCFDCHGDRPRYPWYYRVPGVRQFIDSDIAEARKHLDISHDFPFQGHGGSPERDLDELGATIAEGNMPPWYYAILHLGSRPTEDEERAILAWVKESRSLLFWEK